MRALASLSGLIAACGVTIAQTPQKTDFATESRPREVLTVSVQSAPMLAPTPIKIPVRMGYTPEQLLHMNESELTDLYKSSPPAPVPTQYTPGTVIFQPGSPITVPVARIMSNVSWQGKYFPGNGQMVNKMFYIPTIKAAIRSGESWIDGGPSTVYDYTDTSLIWMHYRDEVREVSPGVYLGIMHRRAHSGPKITTWFALDARNCKSGCGTGCPR